MNEEKQLNKSFGFWNVFFLIIGTVIGSGIFFKQGEVLSTAGTGNGAIIAWVASGVITLAGSLTVAELAGQIDKTGGLYSYVDHVYGRLPAFIVGWTNIIFYGPAMIAAVGYFFSVILLNIFGVNPDNKIYGFKISILVTLGIIIILTAVNLFNNIITKYVSQVATYIKLVPLIVLIIFGTFFAKDIDLSSNVQAASQSSASSLGSIGSAMIPALFAYDGWMIIASISGEIKNSKRNLPKAIFAGILVVLLIYISVSAVILHLLPVSQIETLKEQVPSFIFAKYFGSIVGKLITIIIAISILGTLNSKILAFPRIAFGMAEDKNIPFSNFFGKVGAKTKVPTNSILFISLIAIILLFVAGAQDLTDWGILVIWSFYILAFFAVFILREHKAPVNSFKTPLYPITPIIAIAGSLFIIITTFQSAIDEAINYNDTTQIIGISVSFLVVLIGIPIFYWENRKNKTNK
ncbi:MAG: amino acid permease [Lactobacillaceae bacterium]|jgi:APA family basic amino acid/polyamine antiporter|nr:amino acid permease [Lactobacillaceae bacterium]